MEGPGKPKQKSSFSETLGKTVRAGLAAAAISGAFGGDKAEAAPLSLKAPQPQITEVEHHTLHKEDPLSAQEFNAIKSAALRVGDKDEMYEELLRYGNLFTPGQWNDIERTLEEKGVVFALALSAKHIAPRYADLINDPSLAHAGRVKRSLVAPLVDHPKTDAKFWIDLTSSFAQQDTSGRAMQGKPRIVAGPIKAKILGDLSRKHGNINPVELEQSAAYVARNLHERALPVTDANVSAEVQRIRTRRAHEEKTRLFDRDLLLISHDELVTKKDAELSKGAFKTDGPLFGAPALEKALSDRHAQEAKPGSHFAHLTPLRSQGGPLISTKESLEKTKETALAIIRDSLAPLTVYFDGHGNEDAFYISKGQVGPDGRINDVNAIRITANDLARTLIVRFENQRAQDPALAQSNIVLISSACFSQNMMRDVAHQLRAAGVPLPQLIINASEYGQYGIYLFTQPFTSDFNKLISTSPSLGHVLKQENLQYLKSKPTIFVPDKGKDGKDVLMQLGGIAIPQSANAAA